MDVFLLILTDAFWSALAAMGFAILFNVPQRALLFCMIGGAIGHALRSLLMVKFGLSIELATLLSATGVGFFAKWCAVQFSMPSMIFSVSAVIPMVPGVFAYQTMIAILEVTHADNSDVVDILAQSSVNAIKTGVILASIAGGIAAPSLVFKRHKPVV